MINAIQNFFVNRGGSFWSTLFMSMLPVCEARIAMPFGMSSLWGDNALSPFVSFVASFLGSSLASVFILLLLRPIFAKLKKSKALSKIVLKLEGKFKRQGNDMQTEDTSKNKTFAVWSALMVFVAVPAPMTGVWAGSGIACFTKLNFWQSLSAIVTGNLIACTILMLVCTIFKDSATFLLITSIVLIFATLTVCWITKRKKRNSNDIPSV